MGVLNIKDTRSQKSAGVRIPGHPLLPEPLEIANNVQGWKNVFSFWDRRELRGPSTLTWVFRIGDCKITLEDEQKIGNWTYYVSSESLRDAESE